MCLQQLPTIVCMISLEKLVPKKTKKSHMDAIKLQNTAPQTNGWYHNAYSHHLHTILGLKAKKLQL